MPTPAPEAPPPPLRPLLKWAGGKRWLRPVLEQLYAPFRTHRLVEPFCGALGVALGLRPDAALLNDANPHVINFHRRVQDGLRTRVKMTNERDAYYQRRDDFNALIGRGNAQTARAAALFYYLNRTGYNGLCRFNSRGEFNVPFGRFSSIAYRSDFHDYREVLAGWTFSCGDFEDVTLAPDDFVYADPPYDVEFRQYAAGGFDHDAQARLAAWLARHPGPVIASNQATDAMVRLYRRHGFRIFKLPAPRRISRTGDRTPAMELLAVRGIATRKVNASLTALG